FRNFRKIRERIEPACELGFSYLKLGQPSSTLSGGESQRLKLAPLLGRKNLENVLIIMDEPTTGLHFEDVSALIRVVRRLVDRGSTIVIIEHNFDIIASSDWIIDIGPGAADEGGNLLYQGPVRSGLGITTSPTLSRLS
ncbi:MAG: excinuclease ABC subunit A, partial [Oligoflexales bacterium]|nr:excinuclease ABC subunit A [Oligoflexales bacterium]